MTDRVLEEILKPFPPSTINNSREMVRRIYNKAKKEKYGGYWTRQLEEITGVPSDRTGYDCGIEPERHNF